MGKRGAVILGVFFGAPLIGCPGGADLENPDRFHALAGSAGTAGMGGMGGTAGTAGSAGVAGTAGTTSGGGGGITFVPPDCDYRGVLVASCAKTVGCHLAGASDPTPAAGLDLKTDGIEARVFGQRPTYGDISCDNPDGGPLPVLCVPTGCDQNARLIEPGNPAGSFLFKKLAGTHGDCGEAMPLLPGKLDAAGRACLEAWITAVANAE